MASVSRSVSTTPHRVWEVLADGWLCPLWVVGASRIRDVDASWPEPGSRIHHSVGVWPMLIDDNTEVLESIPDQMIKLKAKGQFLGKAEVLITLSPIGDETSVEIHEVPVSGPGTVIPHAVMAPILNWRNVETLRRLAYLAERRPNELLEKAD